MNKIDYQALREAAEKAGEDKWQAKKINGDFFVIRHGSYTRQHGYTSYQPIAEVDCKPVRDFVAKANPATVLALLDERERNQQYIKRRDQENEDIALTVGKLRVELEAAKKRIAELEAEPVSQTYKLNELSGNSPVTPDGWVMVPKRLTAENGAKGVLSGEFSETTFISCPECFGDDDCETCDCSGRIEIKVPVSWTTIKTIWAKGCEHFSIVAPQQDG
ncbi:ead/Ea22-like family protein [Escherichia coli]|uniref:ead/Ea22-like family protein n=1 Tax=Escherichia coli TaxID=562 RepID=UPI000B7FF632|nr:ead/Ea22-like family protein [Escherichia coli]